MNFSMEALRAESAASGFRPDMLEKVAHLSHILSVLFANENLSTLDAILKANDLPTNMVISFGRVLRVPSIQK